MEYSNEDMQSKTENENVSRYYEENHGIDDDDDRFGPFEPFT